jgi:hypothetical protein
MIVFLVTFSSAFALSELERATMNDPRLENAFRQPVDDNVNVNQQIQISADIINNQEKSQNFVYLVQIKNENDFIVSLGWISGQLTPNQKFNTSLSWIPNDSGEFVAEIFVWEGLVNHSALTNYSKIDIFVS